MGEDAGGGPRFRRALQRGWRRWEGRLSGVGGADGVLYCIVLYCGGRHERDGVGRVKSRDLARNDAYESQPVTSTQEAPKRRKNCYPERAAWV